MFSTKKLKPIKDGWHLPVNGYVYVEPDVKCKLNQFQQKKSDVLESGGLLAGYFSEVHLHIVAATTPYLKDRRTRTRFYRKDPMHIYQMQQWYNHSKGLLNLIGEWHTHPEDLPSPSTIDEYEWYRIQKHRKELSTVFIIVGIKEWWVGQVK